MLNSSISLFFSLLSLFLSTKSRIFIHQFINLYIYELLMHALVCCQASWQNVGHGGTAAPWHALTWISPKSHSLQYHSVCPSFLSLSLSVSLSLSLSFPPCLVCLFSAFILGVPFTLIIHVFLNILEPFTSHLCFYSVPSLCFTQTSLFLIQPGIFVICLLVFSPLLM